MDVATYAVLLFPHDERDLAVGFQSDESVYDVAAGFFEFACPDDIVFFVKPRFQLDEDRHLLAVFRGLRERGDDG